MRRGQQVVRLDLYDFLLEGRMNWMRVEDGDVIVVGVKGPSVSVLGDVKKTVSYEWPADAPRGMTGKDLAKLAKPFATVSHIAITGTRAGEPFQTYLPLAALDTFVLGDGDSVNFFSDKHNPTISVTVRGAHTGPSFLPVKRSAKLRDVLAHIPIDAETANTGGIYLLRKSVAEQQQKALQDALARLEKAVLTQTASTNESAQIRKTEAELVAKYVETAKKIQPDGLIVVTENGQVSNIALETGDVIVVPQKSDVVFISGEVRMPASVVYAKGRSVNDYVRQAGGYSERSSKETLVVRPNGKVEMDVTSDIGPGDQILVMPNVDTKFIPVIKDLAQILYQIAVGARMVDLTTTK
jgi:protein involved in polysaccharide export with SLBB domain